MYVLYLIRSREMASSYTTPTSRIAATTSMSDGNHPTSSNSSRFSQRASLCSSSFMLLASVQTKHYIVIANSG